DDLGCTEHAAPYRFRPRVCLETDREIEAKAGKCLVGRHQEAWAEAGRCTASLSVGREAAATYLPTAGTESVRNARSAYDSTVAGSAAPESAWADTTRNTVERSQSVR